MAGIRPDLPDEMVHPDNWFALSNRGKITDNLTEWERSFAYSMGMALRHRKSLTDKQAVHALRIFSKAMELGFKVRKGDPERRRY